MAKIIVEVFGIKLEKEVSDKYAYMIYKQLVTPQTPKEEIAESEENEYKSQRNLKN